jgi:uncharacterized membrane protein YoaK (UPF0700 family)
MSSRKLPLWVVLGGSVLAVIAGYINAVAFLGRDQNGVTHVTGQLTRVGIEFSTGDAGQIVHAAMLVVWFFVGAVISGAIVKRPDLSEKGRRYGVAMGVEAIILTIAMLFMINSIRWADDLMALAAGLQNAMATSYSGAIVRTTHMTGIVTDLGILVGHRLRGERLDTQKFGLLGCLAFSFLSGGMIGAWVSPRLGVLALLPPTVLLTVAAAAYTWRSHRFTDPHQPGAVARGS